MSKAQVFNRLDTEKLTASLMVLLALSSAFGLRNLSVTADNRVFFSDENERFIELQAFEEKYVPSHTLIFAVTRDSDEGATNQLQAIQQIESAVWKIGSTLRVDSLFTYPVPAIVDDQIDIESAVTNACGAKSCIPPKEWLAHHPELIGRLISPDRQTIAVISTHQLDLAQTQEIQQIAGDAKKIARKTQSESTGIRVSVTGGIPMMNAFAEAAQEDTSSTIPVALVVIAIFLFLTLRSKTNAAALLLMGTLSAAATLGLAGHLNLVLNTATSIAGLVVLTLTIATGMHVCISFENEAQLYDRRTASQNAVSVNSKPIFLSAITSALGFISLQAADAPPLGELGLLSAAGVIFGAILCICVLPTLLSVRNLTDVESTADWISKCIHVVDRANRRWPAGLLVAATLVCVAGLFEINIDDDFVRYFSPSTEFRANTESVERSLAGPNHIDLDVVATSGNVFDKAHQRELIALNDFLRQHPLVANTFSFADVVRDLKRVYAVSGEDTAGLEQSYVAFELSQQFGHSSTDFVRPDLGSSRISVLLRSSSSYEIESLKTEIESWTNRTAPSMSVSVTGENVPVANLTLSNAKSMVWGIMLSMLLAAVLVGLVLKSLWFAIITLASVVVPLAAAFGAWGFAFSTIGLAALVVVSLNLGIVVDDAIHMIVRYSDYRKDTTKTALVAARFTVSRVGRAIVCTTFTLALGMAVLCTSDFLVNQQLGILTVGILILSLLFNIVLLPKILIHAP